MSRVLTLLLTPFPRLAMFFFCKHPPFRCFSLVLFLLLLGVGFKPSLIPFWDYLNFISHAFKPSKMRLSKIFAYPLTKCLILDKWVSVVPIPLVATLVFTLYLRWSFGSTKGFCSPQEVFGKQLVSFQEESSRASYGPYSFHSWVDYSTIHFCQCLTIGRVSEYNHVAKAL
jgi:hypothetical protein